MKLSINFNAEIVRQGLQDLAAEIPKIGRQGIRTVMERIKRKMQEYPAERAGQSVRQVHAVLGYTIVAKRYRRTGNLGSHWAIEPLKNGYAIENTAQFKGRRYGRYVVGDAYGTGQAWMHKGRWKLMRDVVEEELQELPREIEDTIEMVARREGLE